MAGRPNSELAVERVIYPLINEAVLALQEHIAAGSDIDMAMIAGMGMTYHGERKGPLAAADEIGLDVVLKGLRRSIRNTASASARPGCCARKCEPATWALRRAVASTNTPDGPGVRSSRCAPLTSKGIEDGRVHEHQNQRRGPCRGIDLDHPPANAFNRATLQDLEGAFDEVLANDLIKAIVITGAGQFAFAAGADINELAALQDPAAAQAFMAKGQDLFNKIECSPKPVIAAINAVALGGGIGAGDGLSHPPSVPIGRASASRRANLGIIPGLGRHAASGAPDGPGQGDRADPDRRYHQCPGCFPPGPGQ